MIFIPPFTFWEAARGVTLARFWGFYYGRPSEAGNFAQIRGSGNIGEFWAWVSRIFVPVAWLIAGGCLEDAARLSYRDPEELTPEERRERLVELLALGSVRLAQKQLGLVLEQRKEEAA